MTDKEIEKIRTLQDKMVKKITPKVENFNNKLIETFVCPTCGRKIYRKETINE